MLHLYTWTSCTLYEAGSVYINLCSHSFVCVCKSTNLCACDCWDSRHGVRIDLPMFTFCIGRNNQLLSVTLWNTWVLPGLMVMGGRYCTMHVGEWVSKSLSFLRTVQVLNLMELNLLLLCCIIKSIWRSIYLTLNRLYHSSSGQWFMKKFSTVPLKCK